MNYQRTQPIELLSSLSLLQSSTIECSENVGQSGPCPKYNTGVGLSNTSCFKIFMFLNWVKPYQEKLNLQRWYRIGYNQPAVPLIKLGYVFISLCITCDFNDSNSTGHLKHWPPLLKLKLKFVIKLCMKHTYDTRYGILLLCYGDEADVCNSQASSARSSQLSGNICHNSDCSSETTDQSAVSWLMLQTRSTDV